MKAFLEYIPLLFFLAIYKLEERVVGIAGVEFTFGGIYSATAALILGTVVVYGALLIKEKRLSRLQWLVVGAVIVFGSSTLLLRSEDILKWKAPVVNWIMAAVFIGSQYFSSTNMAQTMFGQLARMPAQRWKILNFAWAGVFLLVGCANLFVAFTFPDYWVDFKVFGSLAILLIASVGQIFYLYPYMENEQAAAEKPDLNAPK
ncbi:MAG: inner membrane-spanning protein YciB [Pseudomonadota bacterium]